MARRPQDVTDAELAVLRLLWEVGPLPIGELTERLYPERTESDYATVKKLLSRLEAKECVTRDRSRHVHVFAAAIERQDLIGRRLKDVADALCDGSWTPLLTHLADVRQLTRKQQQMLDALIDELEKPKR